MEEKRINIRGEVTFAGKDSISGKNVVMMKISDEVHDIISGICDGDFEATPLKVTQEGEIRFKAQSAYNVDVYEDGVESDAYTLSDIGKGSKVIVNVKFTEQKSKKKKKPFAVAYLSSVNIIDYVPYEKYNPFDDEDAETI